MKKENTGFIQEKVIGNNINSGENMKNNKIPKRLKYYKALHHLDDKLQIKLLKQAEKMTFKSIKLWLLMIVICQIFARIKSITEKLLSSFFYSQTAILLEGILLGFTIGLFFRYLCSKNINKLIGPVQKVY